jgi:hypothetical protein
MTYFLKNGNTYRVATQESMDLHGALSAGNYVVKMDPNENFYLEHIPAFDAPPKLYGDVHKDASRIINTFKSRDKATGVLLTGEKGSGKTMLSKKVCLDLAEEGVPTIVINAPWCGDKFNTLIQSIEQPCVVMFDEFEKVYDREQQELMLTLLDGIYSSKKLFILTCNDRWRIDGHMQNRPGRIFYFKCYDGLEESFIREYLADNLINQEHTETFVRITSIFAKFNFDMMKAMVEEMNRYNEGPKEALNMLNVRAEFDGGHAYNMELIVEDSKVISLHPAVWTGTPLHNDGINVNYRYQVNQEVEETDPPLNSVRSETDWGEVEFKTEDLVKFDTKSGRFIFESKKEKATLILTKTIPRSFNFDAF